MKMTVAKKIVFSFCAILALLASIAGISFYELNRIEVESSQIINDAIPVGQAASGLLTELTNEETGIRGYLATGDENFLEPYHAGREGVRNNIKIIESHLEGHPIMAELIKEAKPKIDEIEKYFESQIALIKSGQLEKARLNTGDGKQFFDSYRETHKKILQDVDKLTNDAWNVVKNAQEAARIRIMAVVSIALVAAIILAYLLIRSISVPVKNASEAMVRVAAGDLTVKKIEKKSTDEIGIMIDTFNKMVENLKDLVGKVGENSEQIASMSEELSSNTDQNMRTIEHIATTMDEMAIGANTQTEKVENTNAIMENLSMKIQEVTSNAKVVSQTSVEAADSANEGHKQIEEVMDQMKTINDVVSNSAETVTELGEKIRQIGSIVEVITNIANQTNLLALNAAIEAARAGDAGKGFAVVADEVRKLAEQSGTATDDISRIVNEIQQDATKAVNEMSNGTQAVKQGAEVVNYAGGSFKQILSAIDKVTTQIQEVSTSMQEINKNSESMVGNMSEVFKIAQLTSAGSQTAVASIEEQFASMEEITSASNTLASMAEELQSVVIQFKI